MAVLPGKLVDHELVLLTYLDLLLYRHGLGHSVGIQRVWLGKDWDGLYLDAFPRAGHRGWDGGSH